MNSIGNLGGFASPYAVGALNDATGDDRVGLLLLGAALSITAVATFLYGRRTGAGRPPEDRMASAPPSDIPEPVQTQGGRA